MSKPIHIHAWLARDNGQVKDTFLYLTEPTLVHIEDEGGYWSRGLDEVALSSHHGLRPGQLKRVIITEDES